MPQYMQYLFYLAERFTNYFCKLCLISIRLGQVVVGIRKETFLCYSFTFPVVDCLTKPLGHFLGIELFGYVFVGSRKGNQNLSVRQLRHMAQPKH